MPRSRARRITVARLALVAWLVFVVVVSVGPFLVQAVLWEPDDHGMWFATGGFVGRWSIDKRHGAHMGGDTNELLWLPSARSWWRVDWRWRDPTGAISQGRPFMAGVPPWTVLPAPTLLALGAYGLIRHRKHRKLTKLGRTPCPTCGYDATGLKVCPECGAALEAAPEPGS